MSVVYLLHLTAPLGNANNPLGQAAHYIGYAVDLAARLAEHRAGRGAALTRAAVQRGIGFEVVRVWPGDRHLERLLKNRKSAPRLCPCCNPRSWHRSAGGVEQLAFDLEIDPFDQIAPAASFDRYEYLVRRCWRGYTGVAPADTAGCDIPY
jgi:hypothetical protein